MSHALLSPSSASRWLNCTPSARLEQQFPETTSEYADEGTLAHKLGELLIRQTLKTVEKAQFKSLMKEVEDSKHFDASMENYCEDYAVFVVEQFADAQSRTKDALIFLEHKLDMSEYVPEGFGTGDVVIIADGILDFTDLKYGKGVPVSAVENKQMMLYGLGALRSFDHLYDIHTVRMTIYQPRIDNISTWEISVEDLKAWAEYELKPKAEMAFKGEGEYKAGNHCQFCKAKATCRTLAEKNLELAVHEFQDPALLTDEQISDILGRIKLFTIWTDAVEAHALTQAVDHGKKWPGYKLVEGRSNRQYKDETAVADVLLKKGFAEDLIYKKKIIGITEMEKNVGKKQFTELLSDLIIKPAGKPTLVPESDKRPEFKSVDSAVRDFAEQTIES